MVHSCQLFEFRRNAARTRKRDAPEMSHMEGLALGEMSPRSLGAGKVGVRKGMTLVNSCENFRSQVRFAFCETECEIGVFDFRTSLFSSSARIAIHNSANCWVGVVNKNVINTHE